MVFTEDIYVPFEVKEVIISMIWTPYSSCQTTAVLVSDIFGANTDLCGTIGILQSGWTPPSFYKFDNGIRVWGTYNFSLRSFTGAPVNIGQQSYGIIQCTFKG